MQERETEKEMPEVRRSQKEVMEERVAEMLARKEPHRAGLVPSRVVRRGGTTSLGSVVCGGITSL